MMNVVRLPPSDRARVGHDDGLDQISEMVAEAFPPRVSFAPPQPAVPVMDDEIDALKRAIATALSPRRSEQVDLADVVFRLGRIEDALAGLRANQGRMIERIITFVCFATSIHPRDLLSERRKKCLAHARFAVMWGAKRLTDYSLPRIGQRLGGFDHTSVIHGLRRAEQLRETDQDFRFLTDAIDQHFSEAPASDEEEPPCLPLSQ